MTRIEYGNGNFIEFHCPMDCMEYMEGIHGDHFPLIIADPPYNENKAEWDNIKNYIDQWETWVKEFVRILRDNGVFYFYQMNIETAMDMHRICKENGLVLRQMITIDKGLQSVAGRTSENLRSYPKATEYLFYYTFYDITGAEQLSDEYHRINPMAKYLREEIERGGFNQNDLRELFPSKTGGLTGCVTNWVKGYNFPLKWQYEKIRDFMNKEKEYDYLRKEYEDLRKEYEDLRYTFNLPYGVTDVWHFNFYNDLVKGHPTAKPIALTKRILQASSKEGDTVYFPFLGSGNDLMASKQCMRNGIGTDLDERYIPIIEKRIRAKDRSIESFF